MNITVGVCIFWGSLVCPSQWLPAFPASSLMGSCWSVGLLTGLSQGGSQEASFRELQSEFRSHIIIAVICFKATLLTACGLSADPIQPKARRGVEKAAKLLTNPEHRVISGNYGKFLLKPTSRGGLDWELRIGTLRRVVAKSVVQMQLKASLLPSLKSSLFL